MTSTNPDPRNQTSIVAYLAFVGALLAIGIDTALPAFDEIRHAFSLSEASGDVSLIVTTYFLGMAVGQLPVGPISDRYGRRPVLIGSLLLYGFGAVGSALAPSFGILLAFRFLWGIGAAGPAVVSNAIARDLYEGDHLARVLSLVMAVFLVGPTVAPLVGQALVATGVWQLVFLAGGGLSVVALLWTFQFRETLPVDRRRPIDRVALQRGLATALTHRASTGYTVAMVFSYGAFFTFLGSSQPIVDVVYGRGHLFAATFAGVSAVNGTCVWLTSRVMHRHGAKRIARLAYVLTVVAYLTMTLAAVLADGVPPFMVWVVLVTVTSTASTVVTTTATSLALQPMERIAGTAAALRGMLTLGFGSLLASIIDRQITSTITPMAIGGLLYCAIGLVVLLWAQGGSLAVVDPDRERTRRLVS